MDEKMKKFVVSIEEIIAQTFELEAGSLEEAMEKAQELYKEGVLVLDNPICTSRQMACFDEMTDEETGWVEF